MAFIPTGGPTTSLTPGSDQSRDTPALFAEPVTIYGFTEAAALTFRIFTLSLESGDSFILEDGAHLIIEI